MQSVNAAESYLDVSFMDEALLELARALAADPGVSDATRAAAETLVASASANADLIDAYSAAMEHDQKHGTRG